MSPFFGTNITYLCQHTHLSLTVSVGKDKLYSCQRKVTCLNQKICRKKPPFVDRTDVSDADRTDRLHRQSTFYLTHCAAGDAAPGEAQPGSTLFTHWATWCVVLSTGHGCCCSQGPWDMYPLGHPGGESQRYDFEWRTSVFSHAPHLCMPPMSKLASFVVGVLRALIQADRNCCGCPVLVHFIMAHT